MKNILVFAGDSGSGKTTLIHELVKKYPERFAKIVTCTSRPIRTGEVDNVDYNFLPEDYFIDNSNLVLTKKSGEGFYYGTRKSNLLPTTHHLLLSSKLSGINQLIDFGCKGLIAVHIGIDPQLQTQRMRQRGDSEEFISQRLQNEREVGVKLDSVPVIRLRAEQSIEYKIQMILKTC